jgi:hypothetical protein
MMSEQNKLKAETFDSFVSSNKLLTDKDFSVIDFSKVRIGQDFIYIVVSGIRAYFVMCMRVDDNPVFSRAKIIHGENDGHLRLSQEVYVPSECSVIVERKKLLDYGK